MEPLYSNRSNILLQDNGRMQNSRPLGRPCDRKEAAVRAEQPDQGSAGEPGVIRQATRGRHLVAVRRPPGVGLIETERRKVRQQSFERDQASRRDRRICLEYRQIGGIRQCERPAGRAPQALEAGAAPECPAEVLRG